MRKLAWGSKAWKDYLYWQSQDKKTLKRINHDNWVCFCSHPQISTQAELAVLLNLSSNYYPKLSFGNEGKGNDSASTNLSVRFLKMWEVRSLLKLKRFEKA
jgi:hypothetical protein